MKKLNLIYMLLISFSCLAVETIYHEQVNTVIDTFTTLNKTKIAELIEYPLKRQTPIPAINNQTDLLQRFDQVFDEQLIHMVAQSDVNNNWFSVGWRGIMLNDGVIWLNTQGKITTINYSTHAEAQLQQQLQTQQQQQLHSSVSNFEHAVFAWQTQSSLIRVDQLQSGAYRLASWAMNKSPEEQPNIVIVGGDKVFSGSGGNVYFTFTEGNYIYRCDVNKLGENERPLGTFSITKSSELLVSEHVMKVITAH